MSWVAGVDGCKGGWVAAFRDLESGRVTARLEARFAGVLDGPYPLTVVAVDIPVGLVDRGNRLCDREARGLLGARACTVFPAPIRSVLAAKTYDEANATTRRAIGKGIPRQAFGLVPKIAEVDREVRARGPGLVREAHPELSFARMNGNVPIPRNKKSEQGRAARRALLELVYGGALRDMEDWRGTVSGVGLDDLYDALAVLETARRQAAGALTRVPQDPPTDAFGIPMEITF